MRYWIAAVAMLASTGCVSVSEQSAITPVAACQTGQPMVETTLYMGMLRPGGSISHYDFQQFVEKEVAPRWKEGFTILEGEGLWLSERRNITEREPSHVLVRLHDGGASASADIEAIRGAYIKQFEQDAVLRTDRATCADF